MRTLAGEALVYMNFQLFLGWNIQEYCGIFLSDITVLKVNTLSGLKKIVWNSDTCFASPIFLTHGLQWPLF